MGHVIITAINRVANINVSGEGRDYEEALSNFKERVDIIADSPNGKAVGGDATLAIFPSRILNWLGRHGMDIIVSQSEDQQR